VLEDSYGSCGEDDPVCFQRLPNGIPEAGTQIMAVDSAGDAWKWTFDPNNLIAHRAFLAFTAGVVSEHGAYINTGVTWNEVDLMGGAGHAQDMDSFMYRDEGGIRSFLLDDDGCDCQSTLSMGHAMCGAGCSDSYGDCSVPGGVDILNDDACRGPSTANGLTIYFR
jgi:hypothetical protein